MVMELEPLRREPGLRMDRCDVSRMTDADDGRLDGIAMSVLRLSSAIMSVFDSGGEPVYENPSAERIFGIESPRNLFDRLIDADTRDQLRDAARQGVGASVEARVVTDAGVRWHRLDMQQERARGSDEALLYVTQWDTSSSRWTEIVLEGNNRVLDRLASSTSERAVLDTLVQALETLSPDMIGSVMLLDRQANCLRFGAAPSLPESYGEAADGVEIGPTAGVCGVAAHTGRTVIVEDMLDDPNCAAFRDLIENAGLRACWSEPIRCLGGEIIGTFAMYYRQPRLPTVADRSLIRAVAQLAGALIQLKRAEAGLVAAKERAESADRAKTGFLMAMSHDLRTPLNAILGFSEIMREQPFGPLGDERYAFYAEHIHQSGELLLSLLSDALDASKVEAGRMRIQEAPVDLNALVRMCVKTMMPGAEASGLTLVADWGDTPTAAMADSNLIKRIVLNLLSNAMKFTPRGGAIRVSVEDRQGDGLAIAVRDTGVGIAPEDIATALEPFGQIAHPMMCNDGGTGLGLSLARRFAELHGGSLTIDSTPDHGTTVTLLLPPDRLYVSSDRDHADARTLAGELTAAQ